MPEAPTAYRLYTVVPRLLKFVDSLTNWYVRFNRKRFKVRLAQAGRSVPTCIAGGGGPGC